MAITQLGFLFEEPQPPVKSPWEELHPRVPKPRRSPMLAPVPFDRRALVLLQIARDRESLTADPANRELYEYRLTLFEKETQCFK